LAEVRSVTADLRSPDGQELGCLCLSLPPRRDADGPPAPLLDLRDSRYQEDPNLAPIQVLEGGEYLYEVKLAEGCPAPLELGPAEVFDPDLASGLRGRLRPGLYTGTLNVRAQLADGRVAVLPLEVRSRKLGYLRHFRWMLRDIADGMAELVMHRFSPSAQRFAIDETQDAATLYQRFAFLKSLLESDVFEGSIQQVLHRPYRAWVEETESRPPGRGVPSRSAVIQQLTQPGPRVSAGLLARTLGLASLPRTLQVRRTEASLDNVPNRFVAFALRRWRDVTAQIGDALKGATSQTSPVQRGLREVEALLDRIDAVLSQEPLREVGPLTSFPGSNQVLQKREGYREIYRAWVQFEAAAQLAWEGGETVYTAGQRDVATLYEYWVYLTLAREVSELCGSPLDFSELLEASDNGVNLGLRRGTRRVLTGGIERLGRRLTIEVWFNRSFSSSSKPAESWTETMRPDISLHIRPAAPDPSFFYGDVWVHFDAKYRVESVLEDGAASRDEDEEAAETTEGHDAEGRGRRDDLLRMHAYRDAITRSSGAYVVFPGRTVETRRKYQEILPGLGAFALVPSATGRADGLGTIRAFVDQVLDHLAVQTSRDERAQFWVTETYGADQVPSLSPRVQAASFLDQPPADTKVLLGYVRGSDHLRWIHERRLYNLRAGDRTGSVGLDSEELGADLLLLYGRSFGTCELWGVSGSPRLLRRGQMAELGYPDPRGELYFCLILDSRVVGRPWNSVKSGTLLLALDARWPTQARGTPHVVSWLELVGMLETARRQSLESGYA
jgi:predicted component of viral defense system (DUF524 family)